MSGLTGLAPWEFEYPFSGSLTSTFLVISLRFRAQDSEITMLGSGLGLRVSTQRATKGFFVGQPPTILCENLFYLKTNFKAILATLERIIRLFSLKWPKSP